MNVPTAAELPLDSLALIFDRTCQPEKPVGQAVLTAKNKVTTPATSIFNYVDFPFALKIVFPFPDLTFAARSIYLHPEFEVQNARTQYSVLSSSAYDAPFIFDHDMAILSLDPIMQELTPDRLNELNSYLTVPLSMPYQVYAGTFQNTDITQALHSSANSRKDGLITIFDNRNKPLARIEVKQGRFTKAIFKNFINEFAVFELICRRLPGSFVFQSPGSFSWPEMKEISTTADVLLNEGSRRANELPQLIASLGGPDVRFVRFAEKYNPQTINQSYQWIAERIWNTLDGYIALDKVSEKVAADVYSTVRVLMELMRQGLVAPSNDYPFPRHGKLGSPLTPEVDARLWDTLTAVYLDPISFAGLKLSGNFLGTSRLLEKETLLHTINLPPEGWGASILRSGKLLGLYTGPYVPATNTAQPPIPTSRMSWAGSLNEIGSRQNKKLVETMSNYAEMEEEEKQAKRAPLKGNLEVTDGQNEGESGAEQVQGPFGLLKRLNKTQKIAMGICSGLVLFLVMSISMCTGPKPETVDTTKATTTANQKEPLTEEQLKASRICREMGLSDDIPSTFKFEDTTDKTGNQPSFGLVSERQNQKLLFVLFDNVTPVEDLNILTQRVPFSDYLHEDKPSDIRVSTGVNIAGNETIHYFVGRYRHIVEKKETKQKEELKQMVFIGAFRATQSGKSIVVIGTPANDLETYDYTSALFVIDSLSKKAAGSSTTAESTSPQKFATREVITNFEKNIENQLKARFDHRRYKKGLKANVNFSMDESGKVTRLEIKSSSGDELFDEAILRAITDGEPYSDVPHTKHGLLTIDATISGDKMTVEVL